MDFRRITYEYVEKNKIPHIFNKETGLAGEEFVENFWNAIQIFHCVNLNLLP